MSATITISTYFHRWTLDHCTRITSDGTSFFFYRNGQRYEWSKHTNKIVIEFDEVTS